MAAADNHTGGKKETQRKFDSFSLNFVAFIAFANTSGPIFNFLQIEFFVYIHDTIFLILSHYDGFQQKFSSVN